MYSLARDVISVPPGHLFIIDARKCGRRTYIIQNSTEYITENTTEYICFYNV